MRGNWNVGGRILLGTQEEMSSNALGMGVCFHRGPVCGNMVQR